jgi:DNA (cytosine-5)-methyltransferase 1
MNPKFLVVDLFCGAGGTTTGFAMTNGIAKVIACVNHDPEAIKSHWQNHPDVHHFEEDIRTLDLTGLVAICNYQRSLYPSAKLILWASLECTNFSKAKGGQPRDADSRTLADHLDRYIVAIDPDYVQIENVVEFMSWGPLDENGKPVSRKNGTDWMRWRKHICEHGYRDEWKELNSANFGAYTSRNRLFGIFAKEGLPIAWPEPTHAKKVTDYTLHQGNLQKWKAVKEVLDFEDEGKSIFNRDKGLSEKTLERIYAGLIKFVAGGKDNFLAKIYAVASNSDGTYSTESTAHTLTTRDAHTLVKASFITKYFSGKPDGKNISIHGPAGTIKTIDGQALVQSSFIAQRNSGKPFSRVIDVDGPARTITSTGGNQDIVQTSFLQNYYSGGGQLASINNPSPVIPTKDRISLISSQYLLNYNHSSDVNDVSEPSPTILTRDKLALIQQSFINRDFTNGGEAQSIDKPAGSVLSVPKLNLVSAFLMPTNFDNKPVSIEEPSPVITANRKYHYIVNPSWGGNPSTTEEPSPVVVARQDKAPLYLVISEEGDIAIRLDDNDSECMRRIKEFMVLYGIIDIKMRMLRVDELLKIQGFPNEYILTGTQADKKKFIGNSVVPLVVKAWAEALAEKFNNEDKKAA